MNNNHTNKVCLYIATHNKTGMKYFGKTTRYFTQEDLQKYYHGSGVKWNEHLIEFGDDVTMKVYGIYSLDEKAKDYVKPVALEYSEKHSIVESRGFANRMPEDGLQGNWHGYLKTNEELRISKIKEKKTKQSKEWQEKVWLPRMKEKQELMNSKEWLETKGKEKLRNMEKHYLNNCKHYDLYNALTDTLMENDITPRDFAKYSQSLGKTSKEKYLGFSNRSKSRMIRDGKDSYIGLYIIERK